MLLLADFSKKRTALEIFVQKPRQLFPSRSYSSSTHWFPPCALLQHLTYLSSWLQSTLKREKYRLWLPPFWLCDLHRVSRLGVSFLPWDMTSSTFTGLSQFPLSSVNEKSNICLGKGPGLPSLLMTQKYFVCNTKFYTSNSVIKFKRELAAAWEIFLCQVLYSEAES